MVNIASPGYLEQVLRVFVALLSLSGGERRVSLDSVKFSCSHCPVLTQSLQVDVVNIGCGVSDTCVCCITEFIR